MIIEKSSYDNSSMYALRRAYRCGVLEGWSPLLRHSLPTQLAGSGGCACGRTSQSATTPPLHQRCTRNNGAVMKTGYRNGVHGKAFVFNYRRNIPPLPTVHVPRIVFPKKLPCHTEQVPSTVFVPDLPFLVAIHWHASRKRWLYIHRC